MHFPANLTRLLLLLFCSILAFGQASQAQSAQQHARYTAFIDSTGKMYTPAELESLYQEFFFLKELPLNASFIRNDTSFKRLDLFALLDAMNYHVAGEDIRELYVSKPFPWRDFISNSGIDTTLINGKVVQLTIWATTCGPCIAEFPDLNRLQKNYKSKGVSFISICESPKDSVNKILSRYPFSFVHITDSYTNLRKYYFDIFPTNILIGRDGLVKSIHLGTESRKLPNGKYEFIVYERFSPLLDELLHIE